MHEQPPRARSRVAALTRSRTNDDPEMITARHRLAVARFETRLLADAPPLTDEQRASIIAAVEEAGR